MKNFQFRKANNERFFFGECPGKVGRLGGGGARLGLYMYVYRPLLSISLCYFTNFPEF